MSKLTRSNERLAATAMPISDPTTYPLTSTQLGMIYESVVADRPWINLEQVVSHLPDEPVDIPSMKAVWQRLCARHEVLRTSFRWHGQEHAVQTVSPQIDVPFETLDLTGLAPVRQERALRDWLARDRDRGVDLTRSPCWRVTWVLTGPRTSVLVWTFHHALLDGRSFTALLREVLDAYSALSTGSGMTDAPQPTGRPRFADHCQAVNAMELAGAERHFTRALEGFDAPNRIDIAGTGDSDQSATTRKQVIDRTLPPDLCNQLAAKAEATDTTVATLVMAAWGIVMARCSGSRDAVFGTTRSGRFLIPKAAQIAGCLINTLPVRVTISPTLTIDEVLRTLRKDQLAARPFEHTPLSEIARWSDLPGGANLFDSAVVFERGSLNQILRALGGAWTARRFEVLEEGALPLTLAVYQDETMLFRLEHNPGLVPQDVAQRLLDYTLTVLQGLTTCAGQTPLAHLDMVPHNERATLIAFGVPDASQHSITGDPPAIHAFEKRANIQTDNTAVALAGSQDRLTYSELNSKANRLAHALTEDGIGAGDVVAICLPRSFDFVIAALAVLKSGAAFLPIDPDYPAPVTDHMLMDSRALLVVTNSACAPSGNPIRSVAVDQPDLLSGQSIATPGTADIKADSTAYVIYTSGSTGTPKGVMISHASLTAHIGAITKAFDLTANDRVLQFASISFDVSIEEILPTLLSGAELVLRSPDMAQSIPTFLEHTETLGLTVLNLPTVFWHTLVDHMAETGARLPRAVRLVVVGGEAVAPQALAKWQQMVPDVRWLNGYGPTEATITATLFDPTKSDALAPGEDVPIGRPLAHTRAYVTAPDGSLAPMGARGELWLGGTAVAQGYRFRPDLTRDKFLADPISPKLNQANRVFRTGDIARWRPDGTLAFGGRADRQVKVNGFRVELREIEKTLEAMPGVGLALAAVDRQGASMARLIGWVTPADSGRTPDANVIRSKLRSRLPAHMVPTVMVVDTFPQSPGGKIDIKALPKPVIANQSHDNADDGDPLVRKVRQIFADILGLPQTGPDASFYDLGGHSLLAIRLLGRIEMDFGQRLSIAALHSGPTPRQIACALATPKTREQPEYIVPIQPHGTRPPIYGVHVLGENEHFYRPLADSLGPDQPLLGLTVGPLTATSPTGVAETAALYCKDVMAFQPTGPICLTAVSQGSYIAYEMAQQLLQAGRDVAVLALFDAAGPGGRARLRGSARLRAHLGQFAHHGIGYLVSLWRNRLDAMRNSYEKCRLRLTARFSQTRSTRPTIEAFVAANALAIESYVPRPYSRRLTVFRARENAFDAPEAGATGLGWRAVANAGVDLIEVPGGHLSMLESQNVGALATRLSLVIDRAVSAQEPGNKPGPAHNGITAGIAHAVCRTSPSETG